MGHDFVLFHLQAPAKQIDTEVQTDFDARQGSEKFLRCSENGRGCKTSNIIKQKAVVKCNQIVSRLFLLKAAKCLRVRQ